MGYDFLNNGGLASSLVSGKGYDGSTLIDMNKFNSFAEKYPELAAKMGANGLVFNDKNVGYFAKPTTTAPTTNNSGIFDGFSEKWDKAWKPQEQTSYKFNPETGKMEPIKVSGDFTTSAGFKGLQSLYGVGMDIYGITSNNKTLAQRQDQINKQYDLGLKTYGLAKRKYDDSRNDRKIRGENYAKANAEAAKMYAKQ